MCAGAQSFGDHRCIRRPWFASPLLVVAVLAAVSREARADVIGIGLFVGEPAGLDIKVDFKPRSSLESVIGWTTFRDGRTNDGHLTYLYF